MSAIIYVMMGLLSAAFSLVVAFAAIDAKQAFDGDEDSHTLSDYIRLWRDESRVHLAALYGFLGLAAAVLVWLALHFFPGLDLA